MSDHQDSYLKDGQRYWATTTILEIINRPELNRWRGQVGNYEADRVLEETGSIGTLFHKFAPKIIKEKGFFVIKEKDVPGLMLGMIDSLSKWTLEFVKKIKFVEKRLYSKEHLYCGRIDGLYLLMNKKKFDLIDIKTGSSRHYVENMQLSAYANLCIENGIEIGDRIIVECKRDGSPVKARALDTDIKRDFYNFLYAKNLYLSVNKII